MPLNAISTPELLTPEKIPEIKAAIRIKERMASNCARRRSPSTCKVGWGAIKSCQSWMARSPTDSCDDLNIILCSPGSYNIHLTSCHLVDYFHSQLHLVFPAI